MKLLQMVTGVCVCMLAASHPPQKAKTDPVKGKIVFAQCSVCHNPNSDEKKVGPGLKNLFKKGKLVNGKRVTETNVRAFIDAGGNGMPPYRDLLSSAEKDSLIAYLKTL
jgi:cytochrome c2